MRWAARVLVPVVSIGLGCLAAAGPAASAAAPVTGWVQVSSGSQLNVRTGPSTGDSIVTRLGNGTPVAIECQVTGEAIAGSVRTTAQWDRLTNGRYVADAYVARPAVGVCTLAATAWVSTLLNRRSNASTLLPPLGTVGAGTRLSVTCQLGGESIVGTAGTTDAWDRLVDGSFVSDAYVAWPGPRPDVPWCALPGPVVPTGSAAFLQWAVPYAQASARVYHIPASVVLAQAVLESGWGNSGLTRAGNAYFGMKCFGTPGPLAAGCRPFATYECLPACAPTTASFRTYTTVTASFADHAQQLSTLDRYRVAMAAAGQPDLFARALQQAGYATSPTYAANLINLMQTFNLYQYDRPLQ
jgi:flagellar protein FlgJ